MSENRKQLPDDYLGRVYAGVLGKLIGVYLGRPFEGWTYQNIMEQLGPIKYYVHDKLGQPLVITDDDVAGTFTFIRALEDHRVSADITPAEIGKTWLNYLIENKTVLWWGGNGSSTEHTAWLNLRRGVAAPESGSIAVNGTTIAEQIGAQIFIDGWALVSPGQPKLAAKLAQSAASVSHDGEAVQAAILWAAMEAEAFVSNDIGHLLEVGLDMIPSDCKIAQLIADVRAWHSQNDDWLDTRKLIEENHGYDRYPGICHVVPNHALMIMALLYAPDDFSQAQTIVNTSGWDTDCNAGNVGCLLGIKLGLEGLEGGPDWRSPIADRMLISSADGGYSINDAVRVSYRLANLGRELSGLPPQASPKDGAQFHFSLPGSLQGFEVRSPTGSGGQAKISNALYEDARMLSVEWKGLSSRQPVVVTTPTFITSDVPRMLTYELMASPLIYPGQRLKARLISPSTNVYPIKARLMAQYFDHQNKPLNINDENEHVIDPGKDLEINWTVPDTNFGGDPIAEVGISFSSQDSTEKTRMLVDWMRWDGTPSVILKRPESGGDFWRRAWVSDVDYFSEHPQWGIRIAKNRGEGMIAYGTRQWTNYTVSTVLNVHLSDHAGIVARMQGLRRFYAARLTRAGQFQLVRVRDEDVTILAETEYALEFDVKVPVVMTVNGDNIVASAGKSEISTKDSSSEGFKDGAMGLIVANGAVSTDSISVGPVA